MMPPLGQYDDDDGLLAPSSPFVSSLTMAFHPPSPLPSSEPIDQNWREFVGGGEKEGGKKFWGGFGAKTFPMYSQVLEVLFLFAGN